MPRAGKKRKASSTSKPEGEMEEKRRRSSVARMGASKEAPEEHTPKTRKSSVAKMRNSQSPRTPSQSQSSQSLSQESTSSGRPKRRASVARLSQDYSTPKGKNAQSKKSQKNKKRATESESEEDEVMDEVQSSSDAESSMEDEEVFEFSQKDTATDEISLPAPTAKGSRTQTPKVAPSKSLFNLLGKDQIDAAVSGVVSRYRVKPAAAASELINLVIKTSGSSKKVNEDTFETADLSELMDTFHTDKYLQEGGDYPLKPGLTNSAVKKFSEETYCMFWQKLLDACEQRIVYDDYLMPSLNAWLLMFSKSQLRPFRHVATLTSFQIVLSLSTLANRIRENMTKPQRLLQAQRKNSPAASKLQQKLDKQHQQILDIEYMINGHYRSIFERRFRDKYPHIRSLCIRFLGQWMLSYSIVFVSDHYLRYIGWMLYDRDPECRLAAVVVLSELLAKDEICTMLTKFVEYHIDRLTSLINDKDSSVIIESIRVLGRIAVAEIVEDESAMEKLEECLEMVKQFAVDSNCNIRHEAARFVKEFFLDSIAEQSKKVAGDTTTQSYLRILLQFYKRHISPVTELPEYLVDALWDPEIWEVQKEATVDKAKRKKKEDPLSYICLRDWSGMTSLLSNDKRHNQLTSEEQTILLKILASCVKKAIGQDICPKKRGDINYKETTAKRKRNVISISSHFLEVLPTLLDLFKADGSKLESLTEIVLCLDLSSEVASEKDKKKVDKLFHSLSSLVMNRFEEPVLANCAKAFKLFTENESLNLLFMESTKTQLNTLLDEIVEQLEFETNNTIEFIHENDGESLPESYTVALTNCLHRCLALVGTFDLPKLKTGFQESLQTLLSQAEEISARAVALLLQVSLCSIYWSFSWLQEEAQDAIEKSIRLESSIKEMRDKMLSACTTTLLRDDVEDETYFKVCLVFLDFLFLFGSEKIGSDLQCVLQRDAPKAEGVLYTYASEVLSREADEDFDTEEIKQHESVQQKMAMGICKAILSGAVSSTRFGALLLSQIQSIGGDKRLLDIVRFLQSQLLNLDIGILSQVVFVTLTKEYENNTDDIPTFLAFVKSLCRSLFPIRCSDEKSLKLQKLIIDNIEKGFKYATEPTFSKLTYLVGLNELSSKLAPKIAEEIAKRLETEAPSAEDESDSQVLKVYIENIERVARKEALESILPEEHVDAIQEFSDEENPDDEEPIAEPIASPEIGVSDEEKSEEETETPKRRRSSGRKRATPASQRKSTPKKKARRGKGRK